MRLLLVTIVMSEAVAATGICGRAVSKREASFMLRRLPKQTSEQPRGSDMMDSPTMTPNKSLEPTAVGAVSSAVAVHAASRRWLSFLRYSSALTERRYRRFAEVSYQFG